MNFQFIQVAEASSVVTLMNSINRVIINPIIMLIFALAIIYFLYGLAQYLIATDNEEVRKTSKKRMIWGIFGMFIMVSVFGILNIILRTWGVDPSKIKIDNGNYTVGNVL